MQLGKRFRATVSGIKPTRLDITSLITVSVSDPVVRTSSVAVHCNTKRLSTTDQKCSSKLHVNYFQAAYVHLHVHPIPPSLLPPFLHRTHRPVCLLQRSPLRPTRTPSCCKPCHSNRPLSSSLDTHPDSLGPAMSGKPIE